jgi:hypothetical protein
MLLKELITERKFYREGTIEERMERYESKSDFLQKFLDDFTKQDINGYITKSDFIKKFAGWCQENHHRQMSETSVGMKMKEKGKESGKKYFDWMYDRKGGEARVWLELVWK